MSAPARSIQIAIPATAPPERPAFGGCATVAGLLLVLELLAFVDGWAKLMVPVFKTTCGGTDEMGTTPAVEAADEIGTTPAGETGTELDATIAGEIATVLLAVCCLLGKAMM